MGSTPHAIIRAKERYGVDLSVADLASIAALARKDGILQAKQNDGSSIWMVKYKNVVMRLVLSRLNHVITFLPSSSKLNNRRLSWG